MKRTVAVILSVLMILSSVISITVAATSDEGKFFLGDADLSSVVNIKDATLIQKHSAGLSEITDKAYICADVDKNDVVNVKDATAIQKYIAGMENVYGIESEITFEEETTVSTEPTETTPDTEPTIPEEAEKMDTNITIYFSNNKNWVTVNAYLYNEVKGIEKAVWPGTPMTLLGTNDFGEKIYKIDVDVSEYNRVVFNNGSRSQTMNAAISVASSGFYIADDVPKQSLPLGVYAYNENENGKQTKVTLDYPDGYKKPITIWTPNGYNPADTTKKYPVIYLLDGQNQFMGANGGWVTDKIVTSLQTNGHDGFILVGIDNSINRDNELTPDIGDVISPYDKEGFEDGTGERFSNFVADVVVPYVNANYNTSQRAEDNAIIGSSSGGIEAFYIGMENMDIFGKIGAVSPAFMLFPKSDWDNYLGKFDFSDDSVLPRIHFYNGGGDNLEKELYPYAKAMPEWMVALGYPEDKVTFCYEDTFAHNEYAWRMMMPEIIPWLFELQ